VRRVSVSGGRVEAARCVGGGWSDRREFVDVVPVARRERVVLGWQRLLGELTRC